MDKGNIIHGNILRRKMTHIFLALILLLNSYVLNLKEENVKLKEFKLK